jgi:hypothetical protein
MIKECLLCKLKYETNNEFVNYCSSTCKSRDRFIEIPFKNSNFKVWKDNYLKYPEFYSKIKTPKQRFNNKCLKCGEEYIAFRKCCSDKCSNLLKKEKTLSTTGSEHNLSRNSKSRKNMEKNLMNTYGISNVFQREDVKEKLKLKWKEIYGFTNPSQSELVKIKKRKSAEKNKFWTPREEWEPKKIYEINVYSITWAQMKKFAELKFGKGIWDKIKESRKLHQKEWLTVDHIYSRNDGFLNNISPDIIGHICNLDIITFQDNRNKWMYSSITVEDLKEKIKNFEEEIRNASKKNK